MVLATCLWTGRLPLTASVPALTLLWAPATALSLLAGSALCRGHMRIKDSVHFELLTAQIYLRALRCVFAASRSTFKVTPKAGTDVAAWRTLGRLPLLLLLAGALAGGMALRCLHAVHAPWVGWLPPLAPVTAVAVPGFAVIELRRLLRTLLLVARRRQRRGEFRFGCNEPAAMLSPSIGVTQEAVLRDASISGLGIDVTAPAPVGETIVVWLALPRPDGAAAVIRVHAKVRSCRPASAGLWRVGVVLNGGTTAAPRALWEFCYIACPTRRLRSAQHAPAVRRHSLAALEALLVPASSRERRASGPLPAVDTRALPRQHDRRVFVGK